MNQRLHPQVGPAPTLPVFNLFRRRGSDLVCAVPVDRPVPSFLDGAWEHLCEADASCRIGGFDHLATMARASRRGFGLFRAGGHTRETGPEKSSSTR